MQKILAVLLLGISSLTFANNCENPRNTYDDVYCTNKVFHDADVELNKNYADLRKYLNDTQKATLKRSQLAWIKQRDMNCSSEENRIVFVRCNLDETTTRNAWLRERIRECKTIGCQNNKLR